VIELKQWWYAPDESDPTEIRVGVVVHESGRFAGNATGERTDPSGDFTTIFQSTNGPESQRQVGSGDAFLYAFPLEVLTAGHANNVRITLYLFKASSGPAAGDIAKVFINSPHQDDDGEYSTAASPSFPTCQMTVAQLRTESRLQGYRVEMLQRDDRGLVGIGTCVNAADLITGVKKIYNKMLGAM
jgi:hypothetical protein